MKDWIRIGLLLLLVELVTSCAHEVRPDLWEMCRAARASQGCIGAAVVGLTDKSEKPACLCIQKQEGT